MAYKLFDISTPQDLDAIAADLPEHYAAQDVVAELKLGLDPVVKKVLVEYYYVDKDYRSTYYNYYAKKAYRYESTCVRLHFFDDRIELLNGYTLRFRVDNPDLNKSTTYFGYMVLRPTRAHTIGRTIITPRAIQGFHGWVIEAEHKVHLLGHRLMVRGFPYMSQHTDISVCAHAACWTILRHYSARFSEYAEVLTYDVTRMAQEFDPGGLLPSTGLHVGHAERIFAGAGTYPVIVTPSADEPGLFQRQLFAYVESAFPLWVEIERCEHAVVVVGRTELQGAVTRSAPVRFASDQVEALIAIDDNYLPYIRVPTGHAQPYGLCDFTAFIVPLPDKVYYPAEAVDDAAIALASEECLGFDPAPLGSPVVRYFLTTASHLREFVIVNASQFDPVLIGVVMDLSLPQFIWVIEIASEDQWKNGQINTRAILDGTASPIERRPIFLMHDREHAYVHDRGGEQDHRDLKLNSPAQVALSRMPGNLTAH